MYNVDTWMVGEIESSWTKFYILSSNSWNIYFNFLESVEIIVTTSGYHTMQITSAYTFPFLRNKF